MRHPTSEALLIAMLGGMTLVVSAAQPAAEASTARAGFYGLSAPPASFYRVIRLGDEQRWINVTQNETVRIERGDRAFNWTFSTWSTNSFDLARIAPAGFVPPDTIQVYLQPDPRYEN